MNIRWNGNTLCDWFGSARRLGHLRFGDADFYGDYWISSLKVGSKFGWHRIS